MIGRLDFDISVNRSAVHVAVDGEIDLDTAPQLLDTVLAAALLEARDAGHEVFLDLDAVTFLDSSGIAALLFARRYVAGNGGTLVLANLSDVVARTIEMAGVGPSLGVLPRETDTDPG